MSQELAAAIGTLLEELHASVATIDDVTDLRMRVEEAEAKILVLQERIASIQRQLDL